MAQSFLDSIFWLHWMPASIMSGWGLHFISHFWLESLQLLGMKESLASTHQQQMDEQTEWANRVVDQHLLTSIRMTDFPPFLGQVWSNLDHFSTHQGPFYTNYRFHFYSYPILPTVSPTLTDAGLVTQMQHIHKDLKGHLQQGKEVYKNYVDKYHTEVASFRVRVKIWLCIWHLSTTCFCTKLEYQHLGPYPVTMVIILVAFCRQLYKSIQVYSIFHIFLLEPCTENPFVGHFTLSLPFVLGQWHEEFIVKEILDSQRMQGKPHYLNNWENYGPADWLREAMKNLYAWPIIWIISLNPVTRPDKISGPHQYPSENQDNSPLRL